MFDSETSRAWHRLQKETRENVPILVRGLARSVRRAPRKVYSAVIRGCKSLARRAKGWDLALGGRKALGSRLARLRLRSPIYKA